jgi:hypothetical protein
MNIAAQAEINEVFGSFVASGRDEVKTFCPHHADEGTNPSLRIRHDPNTGKFLYHCIRCGTAKENPQLLEALRKKGAPGISRRARANVPSYDLPNLIAMHRKRLVESTGEGGWYECAIRDWNYAIVDEDGEHAGSVKVVRLEHGEKKTFFQCMQNGTGWVSKVPPEVKFQPLYLDEYKEGILFWVEGEKCVDALRRHGLQATCGPMGTNAWKRTDTSECERFEYVVHIPDNDEPGRELMRRLVSDTGGDIVDPWRKPDGDEADELKPIDKLLLTEFAEFAERAGSAEEDDSERPGSVGEVELGWDIADQIEAWEKRQLDVKAEVMGLVEGVFEYELLDDFPLEVLHPDDRAMCLALARRTGCDPAMAGGMLLGIQAGCIGLANEASSLRFSQASPLWVMIHADASELKSVIFRELTRAVWADEASAMLDWQVKRDAAAEKLDKWHEDKRGSRGKKPKIPARPGNLLIQKITDAALLQNLVRRKRGCLGFFNELGDLYKNAGREYNATLLGHLNEAFDGDGLSSNVRDDDRSDFIPRSHVSLVGCIQPEVALRYIKTEQSASGNAARWLTVIPRPRSGIGEAVPDFEETQAQFEVGIRKLLDMKCERSKRDGWPIPNKNQLTPAAEAVFESFLRWHFKLVQRTRGTALGMALGKRSGSFLRLANVLQVRRRDEGRIQERACWDAWKLLRYFIEQDGKFYRHSLEHIKADDLPFLRIFMKAPTPSAAFRYLKGLHGIPRDRNGRREVQAIMKSFTRYGIVESGMNGKGVRLTLHDWVRDEVERLSYRE